MWVGVFPAFSEAGGIQQVGRHMGAVLSKRAWGKNVPCELLGLNDVRGSGSFRVGAQEYRFRSFGRNKVALFFHLLRFLPQIEMMVLGHVNLAPLGSLLRLARPEMRYCVVAHGIEVWEPLPRVRRWGLQRAQKVIAVSAYTAEAVVKTQNIDRQRVFVLPPALDPSFLEGPPGEALVAVPPNGRMLLTVGRLLLSEPGKGAESVIKVLPAVLKTIPDAFYVIVGDGDLRPRLEEMAREHSVGERVLFAGALSLEQLKAYYTRADVFVMPSRQEGFGIVFLEAMLFGKPVIAGDAGGAPEIVQDGVTGFSVHPDDLETLTSRLVQLLEDESLRLRMGEAGRQLVESNFTFAAFEKRLTSILDAPNPITR